MGQCLATQTKPSGKPDHLRQEPEQYSNDSTYFTQQIISLITHEFHDQPPETTDTLLLTYMYFTNTKLIIINNITIHTHIHIFYII